MAVRAITATVVVLGMLSLAGCTSNPVQPVTPSASGSPAPVVDTPGTEPEPTPTPTPTGPTATPVTQTCDELVTLDDLYEFNPNYAANPDYTPAPGSDAELIASYDGAVCGWVNLSSGDTVEIAVAHLAAEDIEKLQNELVMTTPPVPTYGGVDYFENKDGVGTANVFSGDYWIVARSVEFFEPGDAESLITAVKSHLG
ncbi:iron ABC transporter ATP-binding protein [Naasia sp. SYSU D00057]|uniref:iron ABC transporter ATP-binding protein n=1 Tax=Naasia sp. SYSU D00057 TaxID=2817380 RepID=UPI001B306ADA|nr:iron ABC transporter ATP-binding protein [Naasia sp. SYSU D00057]